MPRQYTFPKSRHLRKSAEYEAVYRGKVRESRGPLTVYAMPNDRGFPRMGLSVSRKVGIAVRRNRIRRLLRESFRLLQHDFPRGYDLVVVVRPHEPLMLADYQRLLSGMLVRLHGAWQRRRAGPMDSPPGRAVEPRPAGPLKDDGAGATTQPPERGPAP